MRKLVLDAYGEDYTVSRLPADAPLPAEVLAGPGLVSVTRTDRELSVVCRTAHAPEAAQAERGWRLLTVRGPLEFALTGIMAALSGALAAEGITLFALSTYDTDHLLVKAADLDHAAAALRAAGHEVELALR